MGAGLVIKVGIFDASDILNVIKDPNELYWDWGPHHLNVAAWWLTKQGFKILPKLFDVNYKPGTVGDEGDRLITSVIQEAGLHVQDGQDLRVGVWLGVEHPQYPATYRVLEHREQRRVGVFLSETAKWTG